MKLTICILFATVASVLAQSAPAAKPTTTKPAAVAPITSELQRDIAVTQRGILVAEGNIKAAIETYNTNQAKSKELQQKLNELFAEAGKTCVATEVFDGESLACVPKPPKPPEGK